MALSHTHNPTNSLRKENTKADFILDIDLNASGCKGNIPENWKLEVLPSGNLSVLSVESINSIESTIDCMLNYATEMESDACSLYPTFMFPILQDLSNEDHNDKHPATSRFVLRCVSSKRNDTTNTSNLHFMVR